MTITTPTDMSKSSSDYYRSRDFRQRLVRLNCRANIALLESLRPRAALQASAPKGFREMREDLVGDVGVGVESEDFLQRENSYSVRKAKDPKEASCHKRQVGFIRVDPAG